MTQFDEVCAGVYAYLGMPDRKKVPLTVVAQKVLDAMNWALTLMNLTDQNWLVGRTEVDADSSTDEYTIAVSNYGRCIFVEIIGGSDVDTTAGTMKTQVPVFDIQDGQLEDIPFNSKTGQHGIGIWRDTAGAIKLRVVPSLPENVTRQYQIWYEPAVIAPSSFTATPNLLEQVYGLVKAKAALSLLGLCEYSQLKFQQLMVTLQADKDDYQAAFQNYILKDNEETAGEIRGFNTSRQYGDGY